jgi:hypothetical protein
MTLKRLGFKYATDLGFSFAMADCDVGFRFEKEIKKWKKRIKS